MTSVAEQTTSRPEAGPQPSRGARGIAWARRAPLMPALVFMIIVTQLPFVATLVISFMNWNAYYPDEVGFAGFANFRRVFTDVNMPGSMDGVALAQAVREEFPELEILVTSAQTRGKGFPERFVPKPYEPHRIIGLIDELIGTSPGPLG